jgi:TPR repeat protein
MAQSEFESLRARAEADDPQAMLELALAYRDGEGVEPDAEEFFEGNVANITSRCECSSSIFR